MSETVQRAFAWSGPVYAPIFAVCLIMMGSIPPVAANYTPAELAAHFAEHQTMIRLGCTLIMQTSILMLLWVIAISMQLRRVEVGPPTLSIAQGVIGVCANFLFIIVAGAWAVASFRPEREATEIQAWSDFGWFLLLMPATIISLQAIAIGIVVLSDARRNPLFPRWVGYFNIWLAILFLPGAMVPFFKTGPFAYDGLLVFWLALALFLAWIFIMAWSVDRAIRTRTDDTEAEEAPDAVVSPA